MSEVPLKAHPLSGEEVFLNLPNRRHLEDTRTLLTTTMTIRPAKCLLIWFDAASSAHLSPVLTPGSSRFFEGKSCRATSSPLEGYVFKVAQITGGTSLTRKGTLLEPYRRPMPKVLGGSYGGGRCLMSEVSLYEDRGK